MIKTTKLMRVMVATTGNSNGMTQTIMTKLMTMIMVVIEVRW